MMVSRPICTVGTAQMVEEASHLSFLLSLFLATAILLPFFFFCTLLSATPSNPPAFYLPSCTDIHYLFTFVLTYHSPQWNPKYIILLSSIFFPGGSVPDCSSGHLGGQRSGLGALLAMEATCEHVHSPDHCFLETVLLGALQESTIMVFLTSTPVTFHSTVVI